MKYPAAAGTKLQKLRNIKMINGRNQEIMKT